MRVYWLAYSDAKDPSKAERRRKRELASAWSVEQELLLGTDTDQAVAESIGKTTRAVSKRRRSLGIKPFMLRSKNRGRIIKKGYALVRLDPDDPFAAMAQADGYVREHRLVMARSLGRLLLADEVPHHRNGVRTDNRLENLELWTRAHPDGQRVEEMFDWCLDFIARYGEEIDKL